MDAVTETINTYNTFAEDYKQRYQNDKDGNKMQVFLDKFLNLLDTSGYILDIGSGAGFDAKYLSDKGCTVISIDIAEKLLEVAKEIAPKVSFVKMDMRNLTFPQSSFDGVWCAASLLHLPKSEASKVLIGINSVLKPNGILYLGLKQGKGEEFVTNKGTGNLEGARRFFAYYTKEEVEKLLEEAQFTVTEYSTNTNRDNIWMNFFSKKN